jgi:hypothetical protein
MTTSYIKKIRDIINKDNYFKDYFENSFDDWNVLCVTMDTIEDTNLAIKNFQDKGIGQEIGEQYLRIYGLLQAVFLQQDSVRFLHKLFKERFEKCESLEKWAVSGDWRKIRAYRNLTIGHPIECTSAETEDTKRVYIDRNSISSNSFEIIKWSKNEKRNQKQFVNLKEMIKQYWREKEKVLSEIKNFLENK